MGLRELTVSFFSKPTILFIAFFFLGFVNSAFVQDNTPDGIRPEVGPPVTPYVFDGDLRNLPQPPEWKPGDPIKEIPRRVYPIHPAFPQESMPVGPHPLFIKQENAILAPTTFTVPNRNFAGGGFNGVNPPDTVGDVGSSHYVQLINHPSGSQVRIWDKAQPTPTILTTFTLDTLGSGVCAAGLGDPIVLYDRQADRWLLSEFSGGGNGLCVYISKTNDPVDGGWFNYAFTTPNFPDYPKYSVWPTDKDGGQGSYVVTTNEGIPVVYAVNRGAMLSGSPSTLQRFTNIPPLSGFGFQGIHAPADIDGPVPPPSGSPVAILHHRDTEVHGPGGFPSQDFLEVWELNISWVAPATSTLTNTVDMPIAEIDSALCGLISFNCFPMPGTSTTLDPLREPVMHRLQYMNHLSHQTLVGNFVTDVDTNHGGMRWFELRGGAGRWTLFQEGLFAIDVHHRWIGGISMDISGNIAMGYNVSSSSVHPDIRYTGRLSSDAAGTMSQPETIIVDGTASNSSNRWGDYAAMGLDPTDDCTFWYTNMYNVALGWSTRVASFKFDSCGNGCPVIILSPSTLPGGDLGIPYNQTISGSGGASPYNYNVSTGSLPPGLTLDSATGTISGTPNTVGTFNFSITATDDNNCIGIQSYSIKIRNCLTITLSPTTLPDGKLGLTYSQTVVATGGNAPYAHTVTSGSLPPGLTLGASSGTISGTPTTIGTFNFDITATDSDGCTGTQSYSITITSLCLFCDDFEDGLLATNWTYIKLNWIELGGNLQGTPVARKAIAVAKPAFGGCLNCTIQTSIQIQGGDGNRVWLLAWYVDKENTVELLVKEESDKWILKQRSNGSVVKKLKATAQTDPNVVYNVELSFDGTQLTVKVNGNPFITMAPVGSLPIGTVGFQTRNTTGIFGFIAVN